MIDNTRRNQLLSKASGVANETEREANDANRIGTLFADIIRALGDGMTLEEVIQQIVQRGADLYLSKTDADVAQGRITFVDGLQLGSTYADGISGTGGLLDGNGNGVLRSLRLFEWLEVPELRKNRTRILLGDDWNSPGGGIIEEVDMEEMTIRLKLEDGEPGAIEVDDLCMGYWHSDTPGENSQDNYDDSRNNRRVAGFYTTYFRIVSVDDARGQTAHIALRAASERYPNPMPPAKGMHFVVFGNPTHADRQYSRLATRAYVRYLVNVTTWEFGVGNIAMQIGDLSNLSVHGLQMQGYSAYLNNIYITGHIEDVEMNGAHVVTSLVNGGWVSSSEQEHVTVSVLDGLGRNILSSYPVISLVRESGNDDDDAAWNNAHTNVGSSFYLSLSDLGTNWFAGRVMFTVRATGSNGTLETSFAMAARDVLELHIEFVASRTVVYVDDVDIEVEARLFYGQEDVTEQLLLRETTSMGWTRDSGVAPEDASWMPTLGLTRNVLLIEHGSGHARQDCGSLWESSLRCAYEFTAIIYTEPGESQRVNARLSVGE